MKSIPVLVTILCLVFVKSTLGDADSPPNGGGFMPPPFVAEPYEPADDQNGGGFMPPPFVADVPPSGEPYEPADDQKKGDNMPPPQDGMEQLETIDNDSREIRYKGTITACDRRPATGRFKNGDDFHYYKVWLQAGTKVVFEVTRMNCKLDPVATLFFGQGNFGSIRLVAWGDNENDIPKRCPKEQSPNRDPKFTVKPVPYTGEYTLQVYQGKDFAIPSAKYKIKVWSKDFDGDGVGEACDRCPLTNVTANIDVVGCDTGVQDLMVTDYGCSLNDVILKDLRMCMASANKASQSKKEARVRFRKCMYRRLKVAINNETDIEGVMQCVRKTSEGKINAVCGNRFLATDSQELFILDPNNGRKQFLGEMLPFPRCSEELEFDHINNVLWSEKCGKSSELFVVDPTSGAPVDFLEHEQGDITGMESVNGTLYGVFVPAGEGIDASALPFPVVDGSNRLISETLDASPPVPVQEKADASVVSDPNVVKQPGPDTTDSGVPVLPEEVGVSPVVNPEVVVQQGTGNLVPAEMVNSPYVVTSPSSTLVVINTSTGEFTKIGPTGVGPIYGLAYDHKRSVMWGITKDPDSCSILLHMNLETGAATRMFPVTDRAKQKLSDVISLEFGPNGRMYAGISEYAKNKRQNLVTIDRNTGIASRVRDTEMNILGLTCYTI